MKDLEKLEAVIDLKRRIQDFDDALFGVRTPMINDKYPSAPIDPVRKMHPRLNVNADMLPRIRQILGRSEASELAKNFWELADEKFDGTVALPPDNRSNYNGRHHAIIEAKALAYLITGDELYAYEAIFAAKNYMLSVVIRHDLKSDIFRGWGRIMTVVGEVYDWCYPLMTERDKYQFICGAEWKLCRDCTCGKGDKMTIGFPPVNQCAIQGHGTNVALQRDYLGFAIAVFDEYPDWWDLIGGRFYSEYVPANNVFYSAGMNPQGTNNYVWGKLYAQLHSAWLIKVMSGDIPYDRGIEDVVYGLLGMKMPNGRYFNLGDGPISAEGAVGRVTHLAVAAALFPSAILKHHARVYTKDYTYYDWDIGGSMMSPTLYAIFLANGYEGEEAKTDTDGLDKVFYYGSPMGQMTARSDWRESSPAVMMRISELSGGNHDHEDAGTFQIYYKGCYTAESGLYGSGAGYGTAHHKHWHQSTISHNGLLIYNPELADMCNGWYSGGQERHGGVTSMHEWLNTDKQRTGKVTGHESKILENSKLKFAYLGGNITQAYSSKTVDDVERRMLAVYRECEKYPMFFVIYDRITSTDPSYKKSFLMHTVTEPTVFENTATYVQNQGKIVLTTLTDGANISKYGGKGNSFFINGEKGCLNVAEDGKGTAARKGDSDVLSDGALWGRIQIDSVGSKTDHMLNVIYVTDSDNLDTICPEKLETDSVIGMRMEEVVTVFVKSPERCSREIEFNICGEGSVDCYVSGLSAGAWTVSVNGKEFTEVTVTEESGLASFNVISGRIKVTPV